MSRRRQRQGGTSYLRYGLGGLLMLALVIRACAWLLTPAIPLLIVLFGLGSVLTLLLRR